MSRLYRSFPFSITGFSDSNLVSQLPKTILPLENGDKITRVEFERCYVAMPHQHTR